MPRCGRHLQSVRAITKAWGPLTRRGPLSKRGRYLHAVVAFSKAWELFTTRGKHCQRADAIHKAWGHCQQGAGSTTKARALFTIRGGHCQSVGAVYKARELLRSIRRVWGELFAKRGGYFQEVRTITTAWSLFTRRRSHYQLVTPRTKAWEWGLFTRRGAYLHGKGVRSITKAWAPLPMRRSHYYGERSFSKRGGYLESVRAFTTA